ncbi:unnamed protein product, partial [Scytosiphon promiscuus]
LSLASSRVTAVSKTKTHAQVWGGEHLHVGLHSRLEGDDAKLKGVPRISKASSLSTQELLSRFFASDSGFVPDKCTVMDMGSGFGGTARVAAKEFGCKVPGTPVFRVP